MYDYDTVVLAQTCEYKSVSSRSLSWNGYAIKRVTESKYLSPILDERLSWNEHVKAIVCEGGRRVGMLGRVRRYIIIQSANTVYISIIRPILEYCAVV